jgi:DNA polymerase-4
MVSIDEAYLDMTGTERLYGPPLRAARSLHDLMKNETNLNCSIGIGTSRLIAKVCSDQAKPNGSLFVIPGCEQSFLAPLNVRKIPGVGKVTEQKLNSLGIHTVGDLALREEAWLRDELGDWALTLAGKARGLDAGAWFEGEIGDHDDAKSISHEHTFNEDTADTDKLETMLAKLSEMVCRRVREANMHPRCLQLKLRYSDFSTITRAHTLAHPTQLDTEVFHVIRELFRKNWKKGSTVRLLGVQASHFDEPEPQMNLLEVQQTNTRMTQALATADKLRDRFGERAVSLGSGLTAKFRERVHENPAALPGKKHKE